MKLYVLNIGKQTTILLFIAFNIIACNFYRYNKNYNKTRVYNKILLQRLEYCSS